MPIVAITFLVVLSSCEKDRPNAVVNEGRTKQLQFPALKRLGLLQISSRANLGAPLRPGMMLHSGPGREPLLCTSHIDCERWPDLVDSILVGEPRFDMPPVWHVDDGLTGAVLIGDPTLGVSPLRTKLRIYNATPPCDAMSPSRKLSARLARSIVGTPVRVLSFEVGARHANIVHSWTDPRTAATTVWVDDKLLLHEQRLTDPGTCGLPSGQLFPLAHLTISNTEILLVIARRPTLQVRALNMTSGITINTWQAP